MSIFDKLTDKSLYTGMYAQRNEQPIYKVNEKVEKHATFHAKNFSDSPVQKYGVQIDRPTRFTCWNGLDKHAQPHTIFATNVRTMDQLIAKCCKQCNVQPQPTMLHTITGRRVTSLNELRNDEDYLVIQSGAKYKWEKLPTELKQKRFIE